MALSYDMYDLLDAINVRAIQSAGNMMNSRNVIGDSNRKMLIRLIFKQVKVSLKEARRENRRRLRWERKCKRISRNSLRKNLRILKKRFPNESNNKKRGRVGA